MSYLQVKIFCEFANNTWIFVYISEEIFSRIKEETKGINKKKTKEELDELKIEYKSLNEKLKELSDDELKQVTGGITSPWSETLETAELLGNGGQHQK